MPMNDFDYSFWPQRTYTSISDWSSQLDAPFIEINNHNQRRGMRGMPGGEYISRSHGVQVVKTHTYDWLMLMLLGLILTVLNIIHPFNRFVGKDMMSDLKYPHKASTVPFWSVPVYSVMLPMLVFLLFYLRRRDIYDLHHAILGILFSALITAVLTDAIKAAVGRPRPDFFWRCFPDGVDVYDRWGNVVCHGDKHVIRQGHKSFPSGHTSWSFSGLGFLSLYLAGKIKAFDGKGHIAKLCAVLLPLLFACLVGISRVDDYRHHWQDVFAGGLLGLVVATFCYLQFFPPPYHIDGWRTYAAAATHLGIGIGIGMAEELHPGPRSTVGGCEAEAAEVEIQPSGRNNNSESDREKGVYLSSSVSGNSSLPVDLEFGRS
ncbi:lipid phosphate phosphatase 2-like isoform X2 [Andrographis paniculata]|uniref:lipid phosphate phosphatase 2-like isoform X2 n=1 Tax=Andrographis paniculata TaxID=175694 RepID=UPI0021E7FED1|nr:lipid phosphate phosphatase 2-like isoform X2 [Andrographis paniculata]